MTSMTERCFGSPSKCWGGFMGQVWKGTSPKWAGAPSHKAQGARKEERGQTLGQMGPKAHPRCTSPLSPSGRHPDEIWGLPPPLGREP